MNGRAMVEAETAERLGAACASPCGRFLLTAGAKSAVALRWLHSLQAPPPLPPPPSPLPPTRALSPDSVVHIW